MPIHDAVITIMVSFFVSSLGFTARQREEGQAVEARQREERQDLAARQQEEEQGVKARKPEKEQGKEVSCSGH